LLYGVLIYDNAGPFGLQVGIPFLVIACAVEKRLSGLWSFARILPKYPQSVRSFFSLVFRRISSVLLFREEDIVAICSIRGCDSNTTSTTYLFPPGKEPFSFSQRYFRFVLIKSLLILHRDWECFLVLLRLLVQCAWTGTSCFHIL